MCQGNRYRIFVGVWLVPWGCRIKEELWHAPIMLQLENWNQIATFRPEICQNYFSFKYFYYMPSSVNGQNGSNPALWFPAWAGKMGLSCPLGTTCHVSQEKFPRKPYNDSFIDQVCLVKMAGHWPCSFYASLWTLTTSQSINMQKKNLANIQPSWPHTWSITHM